MEAVARCQPGVDAAREFTSVQGKFWIGLAKVAGGDGSRNIGHEFADDRPSAVDGRVCLARWCGIRVNRVADALVMRCSSAAAVPNSRMRCITG
ncbi:hypothetical protein [Streptomyces sp. LN704]|uniref:hypothetical protein n=1 Tax=unclassified Streptomyces TaxID=2593676 RepID=UPI0037153772